MISFALCMQQWKGQSTCLVYRSIDPCSLESTLKDGLVSLLVHSLFLQRVPVAHSFRLSSGNGVGPLSQSKKV